MKTIKLILISLLFAPLLTNCGVSKDTKATTPTNPPVITQFCLDNPNDPSCAVTTTITTGQKTMTGFFDVTDKEEYETMLKAVFGFCDRTQITFTGEIFSTILASAIPTASNRCSKWNDRGALKMVFTGDGRVNLQGFAISDFGDFIQDQYQQLYYIPFAEFISANNNQDTFIDLDRYANGVRTGLVLYIIGDINSDHFEVIFEHHGNEMARIRMFRDNF